MDVKKTIGLCFFTVTLTASAGLLSVTGFMQHAVNRVSSDTLSSRTRVAEMGVRHKMTTSLYPVQMQVSRRMVRIESEHPQILPIYRQNGTFFMVMRLNKGVNWLSGLPKGRYFINNRPIAIN